RGDAGIAGEFDRFLAAVETRFGAEGVRAFERGSINAAGRARAWAAMRGDAGIAGEFDRFLAAVETRFGAEGVRAFERGS
ncbi:hypothetical protein CNY89_29325, partial [Amaricoccus sp. HAR-UPW-R2A-40]